MFTLFGDFGAVAFSIGEFPIVFTLYFLFNQAGLARV